MKDFEKIKELFKLKEVDRATEVKERQESTAEHCWGLSLLAIYFLPAFPQMDRTRVYELIIFHDLVEVEVGDVYFLSEKREGKEDREEQAMRTLMEKMPYQLAASFQRSYTDYKNNTSEEAKFVKALDKIEPMLQMLHDKDHFHGRNLTEEVLRRAKEQYLKACPELIPFFNELFDYWREKGTLPKTTSSLLG